MKKKPELFKRTGKSSLTLRNFLNNLKENDLHYENKQITQCVFLGVLRLKPVPSIFTSKSVPSVSAQGNVITAKTGKSEVKASNDKKVNKTAPKRSDINKVLSGAVAKRNPQKVKAAVKKVPVKKSNIIKIKLNTKKKVVKDKESLPSLPNNKQEVLGLPVDSSATAAPHAFISGPTLSITPIVNPTKFNPVQNLFDKLKQKIDENNSEPSTSKIKQLSKSKDILEDNVTTSKVCKINAKRSVKVVPIKKSKQVLYKEPGNHEQLISVKTPSPITISDTDSTSKKDEDDVTVITDESNSSSSFNQEVVQHTKAKGSAMEDVIFVSQETKQRNKARTSPRNKVIDGVEVTDKQDVIATRNADPSTKIDHYASVTAYEAFKKIAEEKSRETTQSNEIIVISDESATKEKENAFINSGNSNGEQQSSSNGSRNDVIIIDEVRDIRVSPRLKKVGETKVKSKSNENSDKQGVQTKPNNVIVINEEAVAPKIGNANTFDGPQNISENMLEETPSRTQELNIAIGNEQEPKNKSKTSPKLLKIVDKNEKISITIKKELLNSANVEQDVIVISEKPKPRKNKPPLLPPVLLTPMLLRSELAQKKSNSTTSQELKSKSRNSKAKSHSKQLRSNIEQKRCVQNQIKKTTKTHFNSCPRLLRSELHNPRNTQLPSASMALSSGINKTVSTIEVTSVADKPRAIKSMQNSPEGFSGNSKVNNLKDLQLTEHLTILHDSDVSQVRENLSIEIDTIPDTNEKTDLKNEVIFIGDEQTHNNKKSVLRPDLPLKQSDKSEKSQIGSVDIETEKLKGEDVIILNEDNKLNVTISPRLLRSDVAKQRSLENSSSSNFKENLDMSVKDEKEVIPVEKVELTPSGIPAQDNINNNESNYSESVIKTSSKHSKKSTRQHNHEVILIKEESTPEENISPRSLSDLNQQKRGDNSPKKINTHVEETLATNETPPQKQKVSPRLRSEVNQSKSRSPQKLNQNNLDEIVVINEPSVKKTRDKSTGRLHSELAHQKPKEKSLSKAEVEKVVVLIHDEPKSKQKHLSTLPTLKVQESISESIEESSSGVREEVTATKTKKSEKSSPRSPRNDKAQKKSPENLIHELHRIKDDFQEPRVVKHTTCSRLLRSEIFPQQSFHNVSVTDSENPNTTIGEKSENKSTSSRLLRSDMDADKGLQDVPSSSVNRIVEKDKEKPRVLRSENVYLQKSPKQGPSQNSPIKICTEISEKRTVSFRSPRTEITSSEKNRDLSKELGEGIIIIEDDKIEQATSSRLLRSEVCQTRSQSLPKKQSHGPGERSDTNRSELSLKDVAQNILKEQPQNNEVIFTKKKEKSAYRRRRSLLMDLKLKQKTPMLLRSELAQIKSVSSDFNKEQESFDQKDDNIKSRETIGVAPIMIPATSEQMVNMKTNDVRLPKRKSLIDDLKRKKAVIDKECTSVDPKNNLNIMTEQESSTAVSEIPDHDHDVPHIDDKVTHSIPEPNKMDNSTTKHKRSPRNTKLSKNGNQNDVTNYVINSVPEKTKQGLKEIISPRNTVLSTSPKNIKNCEVDVSPKKTENGNNVIPNNVDTSLNDENKNISCKQSPKRKLKEAKDDRLTEAPAIPRQNNHSDIPSPKESKLLTSKKLSPKEKSLSPKSKAKESKHVEEIPIVETCIENNKPEMITQETNKKPPRKQKSSVSKKNLKDAMNTEENNSIGSVSQVSPLPGLPTQESKLETASISSKRKILSPQRKLKNTKCSTTATASEKLEEKLPESSIAEKSNDNVRTPNKSLPTIHKSLSKRKKDETVEVTKGNSPSSTVSRNVIKSVVNENLSSKQKKKNGKIALNINKARAKSKSLAKATLKPSIDEVRSAECDSILPKQKKKTPAQKILKDTKSCEHTEAVEKLPQVESVYNPDILSSEANKSKTGGKKRKSSSPKRKLKQPRKEEVFIDGKNLSQVESSVSSKIVEKAKSETSGTKKPKQKRKTMSDKKKLKSAKSNKQNVTVETLSQPENVPENTVTDNSTRKMDITVFDFDESEPEVVPLRLSNTPRKDKVTKPTIDDSKDSNVDVTPTAKRQKPGKNSNKSKTKAQAKANLLNMFNDKSPQPNNVETSDSIQGKSDQNKTDHCQTLNGAANTTCDDTTDAIKKSTNPSSDKVTSPAKISPLKQTTITDMFSKVLVKKEKSSVSDIFDQAAKDTTKDAAPEKSVGESSAGNVITDMPPPKFERKSLPSSRDEGEENEYYDDDSDSESRMEWMPEEYAEYKFKYSAKKMMSYKPIFKCKICLLILPTYYRLSKHREEHAKKENPYNCAQCDQAFPSIDDLTAHLRIHKGKHPYTCKKCDAGFWSTKALDAHTPIHILRKIKQRNKRFRCDECAKEFSKLCDMERHTRVHTGEKPCVCNICNKRFQQSHNLSKHLLTHLHVKPYHCEICNKQFGRNDVLNRHLLTHSVDKPMKCPHCQKGFIRQSQLNHHIQKNHLDAVKVEAKNESSGVLASN